MSYYISRYGASTPNVSPYRVNTGKDKTFKIRKFIRSLRDARSVLINCSVDYISDLRAIRSSDLLIVRSFFRSENFRELISMPDSARVCKRTEASASLIIVRGQTDVNDDGGKCRRTKFSLWTHHHDFPATSKRAFLLHTSVHVYSYKERGYTQARPRDQSRDRILLEGSLTRRYAEIEESALCMQNARRHVHGKTRGRKLEK